MNRRAFSEALELVSPALATKDLIPILSCFCFSEQGVLAYDDIVAIYHPLENCNISGAVRGKLLMDWALCTRSPELVATTSDGSIEVKAGRARLNTVLLPPEDFVFSFPEDKQKVTIALDNKWMAAITKSHVSVGLDPAHPWRMGITIARENDRTVIYSSDNKSATRVKLKRPLDLKSPVILPARFLQLLIDLSKKLDPEMLVLNKRWVEAHFTNGLRLFSRSGAKPDLRAFSGLFGALEAIDKSEFCEIPKGFGSCLERAQAILPFAKQPYTRISVREGKMGLYTQSSAGEVSDKIQIPGHSDIEVDCSPGLMLKVLPYAEKMKMARRFIAFKAPGFESLTSTIISSGG